MEWLIAVVFIGWLESSQPANPACYSPHIQMMPEQCHATFKREVASKRMCYA